MHKIIFVKLSLCILVFQPFSSISQNPSFKIIFDSIYPLIEQDRYDLAKELWISTEKKFKMDSQEKWLFLNKSLRQDDITFFKKGVKQLMKHSGFNYSILDTVEINRSEFDEFIVKKGLTNWMIKNSIKHYPKWIVKNPTSFKVKNYVDYMLTVDQTTISTAFNYKKIDTLYLDDYDRHYELLCIESMADIATFCNSIENFPNNIDHGVDVFYRLQIVVVHALKYSEESLNYTWSILENHIDKAYFDGKISSDLYLIYDMFLFEHTGFQYYGLLENTPIYDKKNYLERVDKYHF